MSAHPKVTATGIPATVTRAAYTDLVRSLGMDPDMLISLEFHPAHITAELPAFDEDGQRIGDGEGTATVHSIIIPITD
jgi:hypothetical protein